MQTAVDLQETYGVFQPTHFVYWRTEKKYKLVQKNSKLARYYLVKKGIHEIEMGEIQRTCWSSRVVFLSFRLRHARRIWLNFDPRIKFPVISTSSWIQPRTIFLGWRVTYLNSRWGNLVACIDDIYKIYWFIQGFKQWWNGVLLWHQAWWISCI
jgi:hypothetical protein